MKEEDRTRLEQVQQEWMSAAKHLAEALDTGEGEAPNDVYEDENQAWQEYLAVCREHGICTTRYCMEQHGDGQVLCPEHKAQFDAQAEALLGSDR